MSYYYFVASLPTLALGAPPPLTSLRFEAEAARLLPPHDAAHLRDLAAGRFPPGDAFATRWQQAETQLRNAVARTRAARLGIDPAPHLHPHGGFSQYIEAAVVDAYAKPHPLERELALDRFRWQFLEEGARTTPFGFPALQAYVLKLKLVERWAALSDEAGRARLQDAIAEVRSKARAGEDAGARAAAVA